ncbi:MAG TPA: hypothetical protein VGH20_13555 [Myxococcales bacterium]
MLQIDGGTDGGGVLQGDGDPLCSVPRNSAYTLEEPPNNALTTSSLRAVWGSSTSDVWTAGDDGVLLHFDGTAWSRSPAVTTQSLRALFGTGPSDVWATGDGGTLLHWNGSGWSASEPGTQANLLAVWATAGYAVAVGAGGTIVENTGSGWVAASSGTTTDLAAVWGRSSGEVYAAGPSIAVRKLSAWSPILQFPVPAFPGTTLDALGIFGKGASGVLIDGGLWNGSVWTRLVPSFPAPTHNTALVSLQVRSVWSDGGDVWATAKVDVLVSSEDPAGPSLYRDTGGCWSDEVPSGPIWGNLELLPVDGFHAVFGLGPHDVYAVGDLGVIAHVRP